MEKEEIEFFRSVGIEYLKVLAQGGYGTVYHVYSNQYKANFALKSIPIELFNQTEIDCLKTIDDPCIVNLYQYYKFEDNVYMLMEYCPNDLEKVIKSNQIKDEKELQKLIYEVIIAVRACHSHNIAHCDIKPSNFFIDQYGRVKIGDFGLSTIFKGHPSSTMFRGTRYYMAPEIFQCKEYNPMVADIWALGVSIYMLATGFYPFFSEDNFALKQIISRGIYDENEIKDRSLKRVIARCLTVNPHRRATLEELLQLPYFEKFPRNNNEDVPISLSQFAIRPKIMIVKPKVQDHGALLCFHSCINLHNMRASRIHLVPNTSKSAHEFKLENNSIEY